MGGHSSVHSTLRTWSQLELPNGKLSVCHWSLQIQPQWPNHTSLIKSLKLNLFYILPTITLFLVVLMSPVNLKYCHLINSRSIIIENVPGQISHPLEEPKKILIDIIHYKWTKLPFFSGTYHLMFSIFRNHTLPNNNGWLVTVK